MALSDCVKCWDTPCACGYDYRKMTDEDFNKKIKALKDGRDFWINKEKSGGLDDKR